MFKRPSRRSVNRQITAAVCCGSESLESRALLSGFGNAWADPRNISISFPSEKTPIGSQANSIRTSLDAAASRQDWQAVILRAAQAWAEHSNINIGLVPDRGDAFGAVGLSSNDPRFGEIRVGAFSQTNVIANSVANLPLSGTWGGDVLLNSKVPWSVGNSNSQQTSTGSSASSLVGTVDLFTVALHEFGNSLSLADVANTKSVMSTNYAGPKSGLTDGDIAAIQAVYGVRQDPYEASSNDTVATAEPLTLTATASGPMRGVLRGSLLNQHDTDVYSFKPAAGETSATVTLWVAGVSLLDAELEVRSATGTVLGKSRAESIFRNNVRVSATGLSASEQYFVTIRHNNNTAFAVGDYRLDVDFRSASQIQSIVPITHDADPYTVKRRVQTNDGDLLNQTLTNTLLDPETGSNDLKPTATTLQTSPGFSLNSRYEAVGSLATATDLDFYTLQAPQVIAGALNVALTPLGSSPVSADLFVMNSAGDRVAARVIKSPDGSIQIQISQPVASETYLVCVRASQNATVATGNYVLTADFATASTDAKTVLQGAVSVGERSGIRLISNRSQLVRFDLTAAVGTVGQGLQLNVIDAATGTQVQGIGVLAGSSESMFIWLSAGEYNLIVTGISRTQNSGSLLGYKVSAQVVSDDEGPAIDDGSSVNTNPPGGEGLNTEVLSEPTIDLSPPENPWQGNLLWEVFCGFYETLLNP